MINKQDIVKVYEGSKETTLLTGMIFELTLDELKKLETNFSSFYYIIEGIQIADDKSFKNMISKLDTANHY